MTISQRIDVHQHVVPPFWAEALPAHGGDPSGWKSPAWSPQSAIDFMDSQGIATGLLSLTAPGVQGWSGQAKLDMARRVNEYTAGLVEQRPDRFGNFATVPLPDIEGSLREIEFAFDALKADGVVLLSNYHGQYLGDPAFEPVWAELNRRRATVFIHPGKPGIDAIAGMPGPLVDYPFDTTRTAVQMVLNGTLARHPDVNIILSHAGGFLPYASHRFAELAPGVRHDVPATEDLLRLFQRFYFDTALTSGPVALPSLTAFAGVGRILYGSDYPYAPAAVGASFTAQLDAYTGLSPQEHAAIRRNNALALFPRLARMSG
ncbi:MULTISPECIES: amidohydrolase family protein [unclassified Chromobacterium]|uniref:amidohydrolase family protein n=1 Tax=unclassified Chromobacterium TaxID=2641838 RepID=UPI000D324B7E|nr:MULTISPECIES: amidohydrolase family protein [unclassified Chromobacterium]PTU67470.1 amidohydrolase [Chromobacterium sp. Panama]UJB32853.1 amidohydrolase [Chromobacterium sp. Beijing]